MGRKTLAAQENKAATACQGDMLIAAEVFQRANGAQPAQVFFFDLADAGGAWFRFPASQSFQLFEVNVGEVRSLQSLQSLIHPSPIDMNNPNKPTTFQTSHTQTDKPNKYVYKYIHVVYFISYI